MGGKVWSPEEEHLFWTFIIPRSPKRLGIDRANPEKSWGECAELLKQKMGDHPRREYTELGLFEHFFQNAVKKRYSPNASGFARRYIRQEQEEHGAVVPEPHSRAEDYPVPKRAVSAESERSGSELPPFHLPAPKRVPSSGPQPTARAQRFEPVVVDDDDRQKDTEMADEPTVQAPGRRRPLPARRVPSPPVSNRNAASRSHNDIVAHRLARRDETPSHVRARRADNAPRSQEARARDARGHAQDDCSVDNPYAIRPRSPGLPRVRFQDEGDLSTDDCAGRRYPAMTGTGHGYPAPPAPRGLAPAANMDDMVRDTDLERPGYAHTSSNYPSPLSRDAYRPAVGSNVSTPAPSYTHERIGERQTFDDLYNRVNYESARQEYDRPEYGQREYGSGYDGYDDYDYYDDYNRRNNYHGDDQSPQTSGPAAYHLSYRADYSEPMSHVFPPPVRLGPPQHHQASRGSDAANNPREPPSAHGNPLRIPLGDDKGQGRPSATQANGTTSRDTDTAREDNETLVQATGTLHDRDAEGEDDIEFADYSQPNDAPFDKEKHQEKGSGKKD